MSTAQGVEDLKLNPRDARFIQSYLEHGNAKEAAMDAGCKAKTDEAMRARGSQMLKRLNHPINLLMAEAGLTSLEILRRVANGLDADRAHVHYDQNGEQHIYTGPDWQARARFTDMAIRLRGGYPKAQMELPFEVADGKLVITAEFETNSPIEASL